MPHDRDADGGPGCLTIALIVLVVCWMLSAAPPPKVVVIDRAALAAVAGVPATVR